MKILYIPFKINGHLVKAYDSVDNLEKDINLMLSTPKKKIVYEVYVDKGDIVWIEL